MTGAITKEVLDMIKEEARSIVAEKIGKMLDGVTGIESNHEEFETIDNKA